MNRAQYEARLQEAEIVFRAIRKQEIDERTRKTAKLKAERLQHEAAESAYLSPETNKSRTSR
jgi:ActR/RegA family two-component response regulator